jgi:hypothetical protein
MNYLLDLYNKYAKYKNDFECVKQILYKKLIYNEEYKSYVNYIILESNYFIKYKISPYNLHSKLYSLTYCDVNVSLKNYIPATNNIENKFLNGLFYTGVVIKLEQDKEIHFNILYNSIIKDIKSGDFNRL